MRIQVVVSSLPGRTGARLQEVAEDAIESGGILNVGKVATLVEHHQVGRIAQVPDPSSSHHISLTANMEPCHELQFYETTRTIYCNSENLKVTLTMLLIYLVYNIRVQLISLGAVEQVNLVVLFRVHARCQSSPSYRISFYPSLSCFSYTLSFSGIDGQMNPSAASMTYPIQ